MSIPLSFHTGLLSDMATADAVRMIRDHGYEMAELNAEILAVGAGAYSPDDAPVGAQGPREARALFGALHSPSGLWRG